MDYQENEGMTMNTEEKVNNAINNKQLKALLLGEDGYEVPFNRFLGSVAPTDWTQVMPYIYKKAEKETDVKHEFEKCLFSLANGSPIEIYVAVSVLYYQISKEKLKQTSFEINYSKILDCLRRKLPRVKASLINTKRWAGANSDQGLWSEIMRYKQLFRSEFDIII